MKKGLLIGCSNGVEIHHDFSKVFGKEKFEWINLSCGAMGNRYISSKLFEYIDDHGAPDYVYLQYSGLNRIDLPLAPDVIVPDYDFQSHKDIRVYSNKRNWVSGCCANGLSLQNELLKRIFAYMYNTSNDDSPVDMGIHEIFRGIELCKTLEIPYNWSSYYDYTDVPNIYVKRDGTIDKMPNYIDMTNHIGESPLNVAYKLNDIPSDQCHYSRWIGEQYLERNKDKFNL